VAKPDHRRTAGLRETRRLIEVQTTLDFGSLTPGAAASSELRKLAADLHLTPEEGVSVRLTGPSLGRRGICNPRDRAGLMIVLMMTAILVTLWFAVRSIKIVAAILLMLFAGLALTPLSGFTPSASSMSFSVAFVPLFVGIGIDFAISTACDIARTLRSRGLEDALTQAGRRSGHRLRSQPLLRQSVFCRSCDRLFGIGRARLIAGIRHDHRLPFERNDAAGVLTVLNPKASARMSAFAGSHPWMRSLPGAGAWC